MSKLFLGARGPPPVRGLRPLRSRWSLPRKNALENASPGSDQRERRGAAPALPTARSVLTREAEVTAARLGIDRRRLDAEHRQRDLTIEHSPKWKWLTRSPVSG